MSDEETVRVRSERLGVVHIEWHGYFSKRTFKC